MDSIKGKTQKRRNNIDFIKGKLTKITKKYATTI